MKNSYLRIITLLKNSLMIPKPKLRKKWKEHIKLVNLLNTKLKIGKLKNGVKLKNMKKIKHRKQVLIRLN